MYLGPLPDGVGAALDDEADEGRGAVGPVRKLSTSTKMYRLSYIPIRFFSQINYITYITINHISINYKYIMKILY